ncbi:hypothetical protein [Cyanobium sp. WAJ14-Wanaka]|uniref:hypothetical protein n=1 Tax=Cyanobium sp. WAJ14-Wanaka TaxID=2823725 RepID=UPI0020CBF413|nr:hypothetical protein [Cyanobium sp. WAJ14-Wanaka]MCP9775996.1 hypothetical protein [Cyanobium sp. WAJ14-Wanaka]
MIKQHPNPIRIVSWCKKYYVYFLFLALGTAFLFVMLDDSSNDDWKWETKDTKEVAENKRIAKILIKASCDKTLTFRNLLVRDNTSLQYAFQQYESIAKEAQKINPKKCRIAGIDNPLQEIGNRHEIDGKTAGDKRPQIQGNAAIAIIASCTWYQMGKISRGQIMEFAQQQYSEKYGESSAVNWDNAITVAEELDKKQRLGCFQ